VGDYRSGPVRNHAASARGILGLPERPFTLVSAETQRRKRLLTISACGAATAIRSSGVLLRAGLSPIQLGNGFVLPAGAPIDPALAKLRADPHLLLNHFGSPLNEGLPSPFETEG